MAPTIPRIGKSAPLFEGEIVRYDSRKKEILYDKISLVNIIEDNQWTVLFFYPRDFSSLCPTEIHSFNRRFKDFEKANAVLICCSTDWRTRPLRFLIHMEYSKVNLDKRHEELS